MMQINYPSITASDCDIMITQLDACISIFERSRNGILTASEVRLKSMLTLLRNEVKQHARALASDSPFGRGD